MRTAPVSLLSGWLAGLAPAICHMPDGIEGVRGRWSSTALSRSERSEST